MVARFNRNSMAVLAGVAAILIFTGPPAQAQDGQIIVRAPEANVRGERVPYYDLNLATLAGERSLQRRVGGAVERVCLYDPGRWYGLAVPDYTQCANRAWRGARPQIIGAVYRARLQAYGSGY
jgi:UrcA family protein